MDVISEVLTDSLEENTLKFCSHNLSESSGQFVLECDDGELKQPPPDYVSTEDELSLASDYSKKPSPREELSQAQNPFIPPLELTSCNSSVITEVDGPFKGVIGIDLRYDSEWDDPLSEDAQNSPTEGDTISHRWNLYSKELQRRQKKNERSREPIKNETNKPNNFSKHAGMIYVGDRIIGRQVPPETKNVEGRNFVQANKYSFTGRNKKTMGSYSATYQTGKLTECRNSPLPSLRVGSEHGQLLKQRTQLQKACSTPMLVYRTTPQTGSEKVGKTEENVSEVRFKHTVKSNRFKAGTDYKQIPVDCHTKTQSNGIQPMDMHSHTGSQTVLRYNSTGHINLSSHPISSPSSDVYVKPLSASGIYRRSLQEQAELMKAHQEFYQNKGQRFSGESLTRLDRLCQGGYTSKTVFSPKFPENVSVYQQIHKLDTPNSYSQNYKENMLNNSGSSHRRMIKRYNLKDYSLLPRIPIQVAGLGPDLNSEEYKAKLNKYQRQHGYAEVLRLQALKKHQMRNRNPVKPKVDTNPGNGSANTVPLCNLDEATKRESHRYPRSKSLANGVETELSIARPDDLSSSPRPNGLERQATRPGVKVRAKSSDRATNTSAALSEKELEKQKALQKREMMKQYAENIRFKLAKQRQRETKHMTLSSQTAPDQERTRYPTNSPALFADSELNSDSQLMEMLRRHEEDRKRAEALWRAIGVTP